MTHQPPQQQFTVGDKHKLTLGAARSEWIDAFADLELEVGRCAGRRCSTKKKRNLSQRLDDLAALEPGPDLSCRDQTHLRDLVAHCRQMTLLRGTIIHSHMQVALIDNIPVAFFSNIAGEARKLRRVAMTEDQIASSTEDLRRIAADLRTLA